MDTTVITAQPEDFGAGSQDRVTFVDAEFVVNEDGHLFIHRRDQKGNVGAFPHNSWRAVIRGDVAVEGAAVRINRADQ